MSTWRNDLDQALDNKLERQSEVTQESKYDSRRNTVVYGGELAAGHYLNVVSEEDEASRPTSPGYTTGFPDTLDVPHSINSNRNSLATLISALDEELKLPPPPMSAASEVTLFDFDPSADGVAESTPHESKTQPRRRSNQSDAPPVPALPPKTSRRSSIVYIKSDENTAPASSVDATGRTSPVVRPLAPKSRGTPKLRLKKLVDQENAAPASPSGSARGLRPLSLLQDRDQNRAPAQETRPLTIGKAGKQKAAASGSENAPKRESSLKRALRPLKLVRSETTKQRAALRENEVLPDVVVRPPSGGQHNGFSYTFR